MFYILSFQIKHFLLFQFGIWWYWLTLFEWICSHLITGRIPEVYLSIWVDFLFFQNCKQKHQYFTNIRSLYGLSFFCILWPQNKLVNGPEVGTSAPMHTHLHSHLGGKKITQSNLPLFSKKCLYLYFLMLHIYAAVQWVAFYSLFLTLTSIYVYIHLAILHWKKNVFFPKVV